MDSLSAAVLNYTQTLLVVCCNGGLPFVDLHVWPMDGATFHSVDPTDWIATETSIERLNGSEELRNFLPPGNLTPGSCEAFNLTFANPMSKTLFRERNGSLSCRCPRSFGGMSCQIQKSAYGSEPNQGFRIFLFLAIIPLSFGIIAALIGFMCKMCCCDCFGCTLECLNKDDQDGLSIEEELWDTDGDPCRENTWNKCLDGINDTGSRHNHHHPHQHHSPDQCCPCHKKKRHDCMDEESEGSNRKEPSPSSSYLAHHLGRKSSSSSFREKKMPIAPSSSSSSSSTSAAAAAAAGIEPLLHIEQTISEYHDLKNPTSGGSSYPGGSDVGTYYFHDPPHQYHPHQRRHCPVITHTAASANVHQHQHHQPAAYSLPSTTNHARSSPSASPCCQHPLTNSYGDKNRPSHPDELPSTSPTPSSPPPDYPGMSSDDVNVNNDGGREPNDDWMSIRRNTANSSSAASTGTTVDPDSPSSGSHYSTDASTQTLIT